jgi:nucleotide-binding universal stress UspA family protein
MYKHILVPTDGSPLSLKAAKAAARLAKALKAKVTAIYVIAPFSPPVSSEGVVFHAAYSVKEYEAGMRRTADKALAKVGAEAAANKVGFDSLAVFHPNPWEAIIKAAGTKKCDVIVMASHGRRGLAAMLLGSETQKVLTHSKVPVLVCR